MSKKRIFRGISTAIILTGLLISSCTTSNQAVTVKPDKEPETPQTVTKEPPFTRMAFGQQLEKLVLAGNYSDAIELFSTIPPDQAQNPSFRKLKLSLLISANRLDEANLLAGELEKEFPADTEVLFTLAILASAKGNSTSRTGYLNKIIALEPQNASALTAIGVDLVAKKNYKLAKTTLLKAIAFDPENDEALLALAQIYYMQSELDKALDTLNLALDKNPTFSTLWAERARVKSEIRQLPGALADIQKAVELDPGIYSHWTDYGSYLISSGKQSEARDAYSKAIEIDPENYLAYIYRAGLNDDLGNLVQARLDYQKVTSIYPQYYYAWESLGVLLWGENDWKGSGIAFYEALSYNPKNVSYALMISLSLYKQGKENDAKTFMTKYITTLDRSSTEYFLCRLFVERTGDTDVLSRIEKEKNINTRNRMLFYTAMYYSMFQNKSIALKYFVEINSLPAPNFFEFRLSQWAQKDLESTAGAIEHLNPKS